MYQVQIDTDGILKIKMRLRSEYVYTSGFIAPQELMDIMGTEPNKTVNEEEDLGKILDSVPDIMYKNESKEMTGLQE